MKVASATARKSLALAEIPRLAGLQDAAPLREIRRLVS